MRRDKTRQARVLECLWKLSHVVRAQLLVSILPTQDQTLSNTYSLGSFEVDDAVHIPAYSHASLLWRSQA
jgi:hypothetical protein